MEIKEFLASLPKSVVKGEDILIPDNVIRKILHFANLRKSDRFYHLGCGLSNAVAIAASEFKVKKSVGIELKKSRASKARKNVAGLTNAEIITGDILKADISDATVILFWFNEQSMVQRMIERFEKDLQVGSKIISIWAPPFMMVPTKVDFPFFVCKKPFRYAKSVSEQIKAIYGGPCLDFTASWLLAERFIVSLEVVPGEYSRFVNILYSMIIWINAWNMGVACEEDIPPPVDAYLGILKTFFNIDLSNMLVHKNNDNKFAAAKDNKNISACCLPDN
jgi:hypothetical protein